MDTNPEEISLLDVIKALWNGKIVIALCAFVFGVAALVIALLIAPTYEADIVMIGVGGDDSGAPGGASALLAQFGGLAGLGGLRIGGSSKKAEALATLQSAALTETFIADNNLLPILFEDDWNEKGKRWESDDPKKIPTLWKGEKLFRTKIRDVDDDKKSGLVTMSVTWTDPKLASDWAAELVARTNSLLRARAIEQSQRNLEYLNEQLVKTNVVELQKSIYQLIESQIKQIMVANGNSEFAFHVVDPPRVSEEKIGPHRLRIVVIGLLLGFALGAAVTLARNKWTPSTNNQY